MKAAKYFPVLQLNGGRYAVCMEDAEGYQSIVQSCKTYDQAKIAAEKWQKKENAAVARHNKATLKD